MVVLHVKRETESLFLHEATVNESVKSVLERLVTLHNARLKLRRLADEIESLSQHGVALPPEMRGLLEEQISELRLQDDEGQRCQPKEGVTRPDPLQRRGGRAPSAEMSDVLVRAANEIKKVVSKERVAAGKALTWADVKEALEIARGAVGIVYPMGLPCYDPVQAELDNDEQVMAEEAGVLHPSEATLWFAGKELVGDDPLSKAIGRNEKTKAVVKLSTRQAGRPSAESGLDEETRRRLMADNFRRMEELKKLERDQDDTYLNSTWADGQALKRRFQGLTNINWKP